MRSERITSICKEVLDENRVNNWTAPSKRVYPHQWLWDSCFHVIGIANYDIARACNELRSLFRGQWSNGMVPSIVLGQNFLSRKYWKSSLSPFAPSIPTSGITQPPLLAEALLKCVDVLLMEAQESAAVALIREILPKIINHHKWLYSNRDLGSTGRLIIFHPWETGLDSAPYWRTLVAKSKIPSWIKFAETTQLTKIITGFRHDVKNIDASQRIDNAYLLKLHHVAHLLRSCAYDSRKFMTKKSLAVESAFFNSVAVRNNIIIESLAHVGNVPITNMLSEKFKVAEGALSDFFDSAKGTFVNIDHRTGERLDIDSIEELLPIYSGVLTPTQTELIVNKIEDPKKYYSKFPVPSVPLDSKNYDEERYWQGPVWINTNWLLANGLRHSGYKDKSYGLESLTCDLVEQGLFGNKHSHVLGSFSEKEQHVTGKIYEYYSAKTGAGLGAENFSWSASLTIDMLTRVG